MKFAEALKTAGAPEGRAEALADALRQGGHELATKADLAELRLEIIGKMYQAMLIQTFALAALIGALKIFA